MNTTFFQLLEQKDLNYHFAQYCAAGDLYYVDYLLTSPDLKIHADINHITQDESNCLIKACEAKSLEVVKFLTSSAKLSKQIDIPGCLEEALNTCCRTSSLDIIKYLLESKKVDIHANNDAAFLTACFKGSLDVVKYLVSEANPPANLEAVDTHMKKHNANGFFVACYHRRLPVVNYFLYDLSYPVTENILKKIDKLITNQTYKTELLGIIEKRDFFMSLSNLTDKNNTKSLKL